MALREEAQTLFTVVQTVESGMPAPMAHWRAGFWPRLERIRVNFRRRWEQGRLTLLKEHCQSRLHRSRRLSGWVLFLTQLIGVNMAELGFVGVSISDWGKGVRRTFDRVRT